VIRVWVVLREFDIFVHVEGDDIFKAELPGFYKANQVFVCGDRTGTSL